MYRIFHAPMTTSEYPDPSAHARYINDVCDYVLLEDAIWNALCVIARVQSRTVDELCCDINDFACGEDFPPAARIYVLSYVARQLSANAELPAELRAFGKLGGRRNDPDARNAAINIMYDCPPNGKPTRRPASPKHSALKPGDPMPDRLRSALLESEAVKQAFPAKVDAMKTKLAAWVLANTGPGNDAAAFMHALLELGVERLLQLPYSDENAFEQLEDIFKKIEAQKKPGERGSAA